MRFSTAPATIFLQLPHRVGPETRIPLQVTPETPGESDAAKSAGGESDSHSHNDNTASIFTALFQPKNRDTTLKRVKPMRTPTPTISSKCPAGPVTELD